MPGDDALYSQYLAGDESACDALMLRYGDAVVAYLYGFLHNYQDAEDLMLEVFARIMVRRPAIREGCFRAYLFKSARHEAARFHRVRTRVQEFALDDALPPSEDSPEDAVMRSERGAALQRCLARTDARYREPLWLVYAMGLSYAQAASVLGCSAKNVDNLVAAGKKLLRRELEKEGVTHAFE